MLTELAEFVTRHHRLQSAHRRRRRAPMRIGYRLTIGGCGGVTFMQWGTPKLR
jgi:hypothetical protein